MLTICVRTLAVPQAPVGDLRVDADGRLGWTRSCRRAAADADAANLALPEDAHRCRGRQDEHGVDKVLDAPRQHRDYEARNGVYKYANQRFCVWTEDVRSEISFVGAGGCVVCCCLQRLA